MNLAPFQLAKKTLLRTAWNWLPKAICWKIWLERNNRIFREQENNPAKIAIQARATLGDALDHNRSLKNTTKLLPEESHWLGKIVSNLQNWTGPAQPQNAHWEIRLVERDFIKWKASLNEPCLFFDGASKGNPGAAGCGGVIIMENGNVISNYSWGLGTESNNIAEFCGLFQGLKITQSKGIGKISVFGDSSLLIQALIR